MKQISSYLRTVMLRKYAITLFLLFIVTSVSVQAESLPDPTRPFNPGSSVKQAGPVLQSVMISATNKIAVINGERVKLGENYAGSKLILLDEDKAILSGMQGLQTLTLFPNEDSAFRLVKQSEKENTYSNAQLAHRKMHAGN